MEKKQDPIRWLNYLDSPGQPLVLIFLPVQSEVKQVLHGYQALILLFLLLKQKIPSELVQHKDLFILDYLISVGIQLNSFLL